MIFSKDLLFIHVPKTGGMSVSDYLLKVLPGVVYYTHPGVNAPRRVNNVIELPGTRHETLEEAAEILRQYAFYVKDFPAILAVVRNPYDIEVSRYAYLRKGHPWDAGYNQQLAMNYDFETFAVKSYHHAGPRRAAEDCNFADSSRPVERYFTLNGQVPSNLRIVRAETLAVGVRDVLAEIGVRETAEFRWNNRSEHDEAWSYYSERGEAAVYKKYRWLFDHGFYPRMSRVRSGVDSVRDTLHHLSVGDIDQFDLYYARLCQEVPATVLKVVPPHARVLVVSKGDEQLLQIHGRMANHFPLTDEGQYAGSYPGSSQEAILHLEALRSNGAAFLVFPSTAFWWLDHYDQFAGYLNSHYERIWLDKYCAVYDLHIAAPGNESELASVRGGPTTSIPEHAEDADNYSRGAGCQPMGREGSEN